MNTNYPLQVAREAGHEMPDDDDLFGDLPPLDPFEMKKDRLAAELAALLSYCHKTRSNIAEELSWKKSRITSILSGNQNLTMKTLWEFCSNLGYDFDIVFRSFSEQQEPRQPWQKNSVCTRAETTSEPYGTVNLLLKIQSPSDVARDIYSGSACSMYIGIITDPITPAYRSITDGATPALPMHIPVPGYSTVVKEREFV